MVKAIGKRAQMNTNAISVFLQSFGRRLNRIRFTEVNNHILYFWKNTVLSYLSTHYISVMKVPMTITKSMSSQVRKLYF